MKVFEESKMAGITLRNRILRSATHEGMGNDDETSHKSLKNLYVNENFNLKKDLLILYYLVIYQNSKIANRFW